MVTEDEKNRFPELTNDELKKIEKFYTLGLSRDQIKHELHLGSNTVQKVMKYLETTNLLIEREEARKHFKRFRAKEKDNEYYENIKQDYITGNSLFNIARKYHIGNSELQEIINSYPEQIKEQHTLNNQKELMPEQISNLKKNKAKRSNEAFFGRDILNLHSKIYCRIIFTNEVNLYEKYPEINVSQLHKWAHDTNQITPAIVSDADIDNMFNIMLRQKDNIRYSDSYCKNFDTGEIIEIEEILERIGKSLSDLS